MNFHVYYTDLPAEVSTNKSAGQEASGAGSARLKEQTRVSGFGGLLIAEATLPAPSP